MELPDELWNIIIDFALNFKKSHKMKLEPSLKLIEGIYDSFWYYASYFPDYPLNMYPDSKYFYDVVNTLTGGKINQMILE